MLEESINAFQSLLCQTLGFVEAHFLEVNHFTVHYEFQSKVMVSYFLLTQHLSMSHFSS
jgi:hypothetical protein